MTVKQLIKLLEETPQDLEVSVGYTTLHSKIPISETIEFIGISDNRVFLFNNEDYIRGCGANLNLHKKLETYRRK